MGSKYVLPQWVTAYNSKNLPCVILDNKRCAHYRAAVLTGYSLKLLQRRMTWFEDNMGRQWSRIVKWDLLGQSSGVQIPIIHCVTLGKLFNFLNLFFSHLLNGILIVTVPQDCLGY